MQHVLNSNVILILLILIQLLVVVDQGLDSADNKKGMSTPNSQLPSTCTSIGEFITIAIALVHDYSTCYMLRLPRTMTYVSVAGSRFHTTYVLLGDSEYYFDY